ncbi:unnamed protein product [marine sediment metagenome]|uniref:Uncharacterized protein n=1 Tax=marine sediment metagenome TaxID=412755 RepID=X1SIA0_9ZZZZ
MGFGVKQADVTAIKDKTNNLPADPSSQTTVVSQIQASHVTTDGLVSTVDGVVDAPGKMLSLSPSPSKMTEYLDLGIAGDPVATTRMQT